jgi:hypothetical protein
MGQLKQMQIVFVPVEDRLMFRVNTSNRQEFRFWMTRRYVGILWKAVLDMLRKRHVAEKPPEVAEKEAPLEAAILSMEHQKAVEKADFKTEYQESSYLPLGESPTLLAKVAVKVSPDQEVPLLCMHPEKGEGIEIALNDQILHSMCRLLSDCAKQADWELKLDFGEAEQFLPKQGLN